MFARRFLLRKKGLRERWRNLSFKVWYLFVGNEDGSVWPNNTKDFRQKDLLKWPPLVFRSFRGLFQSIMPTRPRSYLFCWTPSASWSGAVHPNRKSPHYHRGTIAGSLRYRIARSVSEEVEAKPNSRIHATLAFFLSISEKAKYVSLEDTCFN